MTNDEPKLTEGWVVQFEDRHHKRLHAVLMDAGFSFEVTSNLQVGRSYVHPKKPIKVLLEDGDEDAPWLECKVYYRGNVQVAEDYSSHEWNWLSSGPETAENTIEMLKRELHILVHIRPHYMTMAQLAAITQG